MFFTVCPTGWEPDQVTVRRKGRLEISHLNPRSEELYSGNDIAKKEKKIPVYPKWHRPKGPPHSVCLLRERPAVSTQCACPRARTSRILFSKVFGKANQVQRYWCWDITELTLSWFAHTHTSIYMAQCKVHSCTLAQKRRFFLSQKQTFSTSLLQSRWYATQTHTCQHPLPFPWGISWQLHPESVKRLPVSRSPLPPTLTGHTRLPQPFFRSRDPEASDAPFSETLTASNTCPRLGSYLADLWTLEELLMWSTAI